MKRIDILIAGLPGSMATEVAKAVVKQPDMKLMEVALSEQSGTRSFGDRCVLLVPPDHHSIVLEQNPSAIVVDFTVPGAVNRNAQLYVGTGHHFVMGTTGGDREALISTVQGSGVSAVIDVNMSPPLVVLKAMIGWAADHFPKSFSGLALAIEESHQPSKKDVSGTAKEFQDAFRRLGVRPSDITSIRDRDEGHAYHWLRLLSQDQTLGIKISMKVDGRSTYVLGVLAAIRALERRTFSGNSGRVYSMQDVLGRRIRRHQEV